MARTPQEVFAHHAQVLGIDTFIFAAGLIRLQTVRTPLQRTS